MRRSRVRTPLAQGMPEFDPVVEEARCRATYSPIRAAIYSLLSRKTKRYSI
jgi:hypothetical protein